MPTLIRTLIAATVPLLLVAVTPNPAHAAVLAAGFVQGSGSIYPPLTVIPAAHAFSFGGSVTGLVVDGSTVSTSASCSASGQDIGTIAESIGVVSASCAGAMLPIGQFVRVGTVVVAAFADLSGGLGAGSFLFTPDQLPPGGVSSYQLVGVGSLVHA